MILPTKHLSEERALLTVGGKLLQHLDRPKTVSALWDKISCKKKGREGESTIITYDWFVLTLDLLFTFGAIDIKDGLVTRQVK